MCSSACVCVKRGRDVKLKGTNCAEKIKIIPGYVNTIRFFSLRNRKLFVKPSYPHSLISLKYLWLNVKMETNY